MTRNSLCSLKCNVLSVVSPLNLHHGTPHREYALGELAWRYSALSASTCCPRPSQITATATASSTSLDSDFERLLSSSPTATRQRAWRQSMAAPSTEPERPTIITLDVSGRHFKVSSDILIAESGFFKRQLSAQYNWTPQRDGTYFIDADPALFEHLLNFGLPSSPSSGPKTRGLTTTSTSACRLRPSTFR